MSTKLRIHWSLALLIICVCSSCGDSSTGGSRKTLTALPGPIYDHPDPVADAKLTPLGEQFLKALRTNDEDLFRQCWFSIEARTAARREEEPEWTDDILAYYQTYDELIVQLAGIYHSIYRDELIRNVGSAEALARVELHEVAKTESGDVATIVLKLPNGAYLNFRVDGVALDQGRWTFSGEPSSLIDCVEDGVPELIITKASGQNAAELDRVLGEIEEWWEE